MANDLLEKFGPTPPYFVFTSLIIVYICIVLYNTKHYSFWALVFAWASLVVELVTFALMINAFPYVVLRCKAIHKLIF